jgi:hypothetical protein
VNTPCDETTSIRDVVDDATNLFPTFMVRADKVITVNATSNTQSKTYTLRVNQQVANISDRIWKTVTITVTDCMITDIVPPPAPTTGISYSIFALTDWTINLNTPGFVQTPACGYTLNESITWTIPVGAPITVDAVNKYLIKAHSTRNLDDGIYPLVIKNTVSYLNSAGTTQNWTPQ